MPNFPAMLKKPGAMKAKGKKPSFFGKGQPKGKKSATASQADALEKGAC